MEDVRQEFQIMVDYYHNLLWSWQNFIFYNTTEGSILMGKLYDIQFSVYEKNLEHWLDSYNDRVNETLIETGMDQHPELTGDCLKLAQEYKKQMRSEISASHDTCVKFGEGAEKKLNETGSESEKYLDTIHEYVGTTATDCLSVSTEMAELCLYDMVLNVWPKRCEKVKIEVYEPTITKLQKMVNDLDEFYTKCNIYVDELASGHQNSFIGRFKFCLKNIKPNN